MKSELIACQFTQTFPCLMKSKVSGNIVLFESEVHGTVVFIGEQNTVWKLGQSSRNFQSNDTSNWELLSPGEKVILSN